VQTSALQKTSERPLYKQLMQRLRNDITAGVYPAGERIPGEQALCEIYGVSRVTVRKALEEIVRGGLLVRRQGKGTFVARKRSSVISATSPAFRMPARRSGKRRKPA
jgi:GntR family transcriptional regulator, frlABCD operon transcriptional regulator